MGPGFLFEFEKGENGFIDKVDFFWAFIALDTKARLGLWFFFFFFLGACELAYTEHRFST